MWQNKFVLVVIVIIVVVQLYFKSVFCGSVNYSNETFIQNILDPANNLIADIQRTLTISDAAVQIAIANNVNLITRAIISIKDNTSHVNSCQLLLDEISNYQNKIASLVEAEQLANAKTLNDKLKSIDAVLQNAQSSLTIDQFNSISDLISSLKNFQVTYDKNLQTIINCKESLISQSTQIQNTYDNQCTKLASKPLSNLASCSMC
jgi:hypothetical protein